MGNCIGRQVQHAVTPYSPVLEITPLTTTVATSLAASLPREVFLNGLKVVLWTKPETAPAILNAFKKEMAPEHGLAQLYQVLAGGDFNKLPTPEALRVDLRTFCKSDPITDKALVLDTLTSLTSRIAALVSARAVHPALILSVAEISQELLKSHIDISATPANTLEKLTLEQVTPLLTLFNRAASRISPGENLVHTHIFLIAKHAELQAIHTLRRYGGHELRYMSPELQNIREVVIAAVQQNGAILRFASASLRNAPDVVMIAVQNDGYALEFATLEQQNNPEIVMAAVQQNGLALQFASDMLRDVPELVLAAISETGFALEFATAERRNDPEIVLAAVQQNGFTLVFAAVELRNDPEIVMPAVQENGLALQFANVELQNDPRIVMAAIEEDGLSLEFASLELRNNRDLVMTAVQQNGLALEFVGVDLRNDPGLVLAAAQNLRNALHLPH